MNFLVECRTTVNNFHILEKILLAASTFIFLILFFDCLFQNLPLSGYGVIFCTFLIIGCTSLSLYHAIIRIPQDNWKPRGKLEEWCWFHLQKKEKTLLNAIFDTEISSFKYPTNLNEQMRLLLKDIERDYVKPWYAEISANPSFLFDSHLVLEEVMLKVVTKLKSANWKHVIKGILFVYLNHLQEYKRSLRRCKSTVLNSNEPKKNLGDVYRYCHPGSLSDQALNHYLSKIMEILLRENAPHDFVISLENSILSSILARKMLKTLIFNFEEPSWIYIRLLYLFNTDKYSEIMKGRSYSIKEVTLPPTIDESNLKFKMKPILLSRKSNLTYNIFDRTIGSKVFNMPTSNSQKKDVLTLPLPTAKHEPNISSVLGNLISSTAAPLLPDNVSLCYQPLNKMWLSPVTELKQEITELTDSVVNPFFKTIAEGLKIDEKKGNALKEKFSLSRKGLTRSKSSDSMSVSEDLNPPLGRRDVSVGEELSENVFEESGRRLVKTHSFDAGSADDIDGGDKSKGDVSPVYEEPEDFATTIAKLRCVLQQRESSSTLSDKSNPSIESQGTFSKENTFDSGDKVLPLDAPSPEPLQVVACDIPSDGRPFVNVCIPRTEIHDSSSSCYVLYTIQYEGIYVKQDSDDDSQLVLQTTVVKRRFQEFLNLQTRLEESPSLRSYLKGIKGPSKWSNLTFTAKTDEATTASRRPILESYLQQLCSKLELATSPVLQEFLAYGSNGVTAFSSKDSNSSIQKIDKFLSNKVTGVFNSIKTVLPSFDGNSSSASTPLTDAKEAKSGSEQNILQGFLNFGSKPEDFPAISLNFIVQEASGEALTDDVRFLLSEKSDCIEDALDVLDSSDWLTEEGECHVLSTNGCAWRDFKDAVIDDDLDKFDSDHPVFNLVLDILSELLDTTDGWITKEPTVHILKVLLQHSEKELQDRLSLLDWDRICGNLVRLCRTAIFTTTSSESAELIPEQVQAELCTAIFNCLQPSIGQFVGMRSLEKAVNLLVESLAHARCNRDGLLRFFDILLSQLLSCPHLTTKSS